MSHGQKVQYAIEGTSLEKIRLESVFSLHLTIIQIDLHLQNSVKHETFGVTYFRFLTVKRQSQDHHCDESQWTACFKQPWIIPFMLKGCIFSLV